MFAATGEQGAGAEDVGAEEVVVAAPDSDFGGDVKNGVDAAAGGAHGGFVIERGADEADAAFFQVGGGCAGEHGDGATGGEEVFDKVAAEEPGAAGNEDGSRWFVTY
ncbi:hypothetical protein RAHE111665_11540 [Rariglobus hedericola]